jgi:hypothetical protein
MLSPENYISMNITTTQTRLASTPGTVYRKYITDNGFHELNVTFTLLLDKYHQCQELRNETWTESENEG